MVNKNLLNLIKNTIEVENNLEKTILDILIDNISDYDNLNDIKHYMENEAICVNGSVGGLIYYSDTEEIFRNYFNEIFDLYNELKEEYGELNFELNANNLVWFTFEEITRKWYYNYIENLDIEDIEE